MRVLHAPTDIAGQGSLSVLGLRAVNQPSVGIFADHPFAYTYLPPGLRPNIAGSMVSRRIHKLALLGLAATEFDVLHFHFLESFLSDRYRGFEMMFYRSFRRKIIVEAWGSEVRSPSITQSINPFYLKNEYEDDKKAELKIKTWVKATQGHVITFDHQLRHSLLPFFNHVHYVPQRVDTQAFRPIYPNPENSRPKVVHIPSNTLLKGTDEIRRVVSNLKQKRMQFEYIELTGVSHEQAMQVVASADLVIDQLRLGAHGVFALEAMAMGKPVVCYLLDPPVTTPIINANPVTLEAVLEEWLQLPQQRYERGIASRQYVEVQHDIRVVARSLMEVYAALPT